MTIDLRPSPVWFIEHDPITIVAWRDVAAEQLNGHPVLSDYTERYWLPLLGPTALVALRHMARWLRIRPEFPLPLARLSAELGLGHGVAPNSPVVKTLHRLARFNMARVEDDRFAVRLSVPTLGSRSLARLPEHLRSIHEIDAKAEPLTRSGQGPMADLLAS